MENTLNNELIRDSNWYTAVYRASEEIRMHLYRKVPKGITNPKSCLLHLIRAIKRAKISIVRKLKKKLGKLAENEEANGNEIQEMKEKILSIEDVDEVVICRFLIPQVLLIPVPDNYVKPVDEKQERALSLLCDSSFVKEAIEKETMIVSVPRHSVNASNLDDVAKDAIKSSSREVLKGEKKSLKLETMTRKQRRAAEFRIMREAESKGSKFISSLHASSSIGSASATSRKDAARKAIMGMEIANRIKEKVYEKDEEKPKEKLKEKTKKTKEKTKEKLKKTKAEQMHPSWEAQKENKEKQKLHISTNTPPQNKKVVFN